MREWKPTEKADIIVSELLGSFGLFFTLYFLFIRFLPTINMAEVKSIIPTHSHDKHADHADHAHAEKGDTLHG